MGKGGGIVFRNPVRTEDLTGKQKAKITALDISKRAAELYKNLESDHLPDSEIIGDIKELAILIGKAKKHLTD